VKILDKYILKTFITVFLTVFIILFFIFVLQTVWLFIAELAGKDLDFILVLKFLLFAMPRIIPLVLPLSILLASIMTFGNLAENYEFAAMKSAGISLQRGMKSLIVFISLLSVLAFVFANNVIPYSEFKFINFRKNIAQRKPAMAIGVGQFNEIGNYNIKVDKKIGENGNQLKGVTIHRKSLEGNGLITVIKSENGKLISSENSNILQLVLYDGYYYEEVVPKNYNDRKRLPFAKATFKKEIINMDLSKLNPTDMNDQSVTNTTSMLNFSELKYTIDSLDKNYKKNVNSFVENIYQRTGIASKTSGVKKMPEKIAAKHDILASYTNLQKAQIYQIANSTISNIGYTIDSSSGELENNQKNLNSHWLALFDKFVIAYACLMMFFIGAPLGAIIRKGGLGLPIVFAVLIFITFHILNTFGKKVAEENEIAPVFGSWLSSIVLTPLAILLTYRATNDIGLINLDIITQPFQKIFKRIFSQQN
jgi:lipopolysaccharide export system permease protein